MITLDRSEIVLTDYPFFRDLEPHFVDVILKSGPVRCSFAGGQYLFSENHAADKFYLIHRGKVVLQSFLGRHRFVTLRTTGPGDILGWSWLVPSRRWRFSAMAMTPVAAVELNGWQLRHDCETNREFAGALPKRFVTIEADRLESTRKWFAAMASLAELQGASVVPS